MSEKVKKQNVIYITYDKNLKEFIRSNGMESLVYGVNPKSNGMFWVFERTEFLNELLDKWFKK